ncbi:hypothetical protein [Clostridium sp.]|jgi:hypothetical protein|uniref:hypothetical protein n=1 Tax=Clostridium sp. TaxID=1506 RepID=UPI003EECE39C
MPKLDISFKQTSKDMKLYSKVMAEEEKSDFVKRAIEIYIKYLEGGCNAKSQ